MEKVYYITTASIFAVIGTVHLIRAIQGWEAVVGGVLIPVWVSWIAVAVAWYLAMRGFQYSRRTWLDRIFRRS